MKNILVVGASSRLGKVVVEKLSQKGYKVFATSRKNQDLKKTWEKNFPKIQTFSLDLKNENDCNFLIEEIIKKEKRIDVLINCAGMTLVGPFDDFKEKDFEDILDTNVLGAFRIIKAVLPSMKKNHSGQIITVTSLSGLIAFPNFSLYSASKFAVEGLLTSLRYELLKFNIKFTLVEPGAIHSEEELVKPMPHKSAREKFLILKLLLPLVTREEIADKIVSLIESKNPPINLKVGRDAFVTTTINKLLPAVFWNKLMEMVWSK